MSSHSSNLIGRTFRAIIAEPWDFSSEAGENVLEGKIIDVSTRSDICEWIKCKITPFKVGSTIIHEVAIVHRYKETESIACQLLKGMTVGANLVYDPDSGDLPIDKLREAIENKKGLCFLVGSVELS